MSALFANFAPDFSSFLTRSVSTDSDHWPVSRNFLLDEHIARERAECYRHHGAVADHRSVAEWEFRHKIYLKKEISIESDDIEPPPEYIDPEDPDICPDTFRFPMLAPSLAKNLASDLIRVQKVSSFNRVSQLSSKYILALAAGAMANNQDAFQRLDGLLGQFAGNRDWRPVFSGVWSDLADVFGETPEEDPPDWADDLRDRLGLCDCDPRQSESLGILVFRYPIQAVPRLSTLGDRARPLTIPCVLDGVFSHAFLPSPSESDTGHTMDLTDARPCGKLIREVLHPAMRLQTKYLFRVGAITRPVDPNALGMQRGLHLTCLRERFERPEYGQHTDRDLLS
uniref:Uncharacterized protein n=1 Tax=Candidatus Kentrum sp. UNK TaxID=2126344 RepID=A0A451AX10_9GAMM|nr:MAG: hypothetical protein BECKUNK1418G_GA0071005_102623 [Candidatus Kentron sp. UNK]VFK70580.1 MAG: hypothetical protein BECKUNK1418H_GA0071006_103223 [Candidatus Kentron sp. UNK]